MCEAHLYTHHHHPPPPKKKRKKGGWANNNDVTTTNSPFPLLSLPHMLTGESMSVFSKHRPCQDLLDLWTKEGEGGLWV